MQQVSLDQLATYTPFLINALKALVVLVVGWIVAGFTSRMLRRRVMASPNLDQPIGNCVAGTVRWVILLVVLIAVLNLFGIEATSLVAVLGAATLAIGLALQGTLSNVAAGIMLIAFRPYKLGQFVDIAGTAGTVKDVNLFFTELATPDNIQIIVPNGQAWGAIITNFSSHETRRIDLVFGIDYGDSADKAMEIIQKVVAAEERVRAEPEPWVRVTNLGSSSVDITLRAWATTADFWDTKFALTKAIKEAFDEGGITIPYPHTVEIQK
jgi:small conductance mechanosensitive channel